jgi:hypothetical protein
VIVAIAVGAASPASAQKIDLNQTREMIADLTLMFHDSRHGTQVEYNAADGSTYLLYPGNAVIVKGSWKVTRTDKPNVYNMCFKYPANSYNPVTQQAGGNWECQIAGFYLARQVENMEGDVLGLSSRTEVPFVLARRKTTLAALIRKAH